MRKKSLYTKAVGLILGLTVIFNLIALNRDFCNYYAEHIFGYFNAAFGTLTSWCPIAIGEIIMYLGAVVLIVQVLLLILLIFYHKREGFKRFTVKYSKCVGLTVSIFLLIFTTNWFISFRSDVLEVSSNQRKTYSFEEVTDVFSMIVENLNETAQEIDRDENGSVIYNYSEGDIVEAMRGLSPEFPRMAGHYSHLKPALCSPFLKWMDIGGYNYPYTMEPTYNKYMAPHYVPVLQAHEYVHHKGYYKENEGEFLSCLALSKSDNPVLRYSGYYEMYCYFSHDFKDAFINDFLAKEGELTEDNFDLLIAERDKYPKISEQVQKDIDESFAIADEIYNREVSKKLEDTFSEASNEVSSKGWEIHGDVLKENSYDGLSLMLLQYYVDKAKEETIE